MSTSFFSLPREIRDQIYEYVLTADDNTLSYRVCYGVETDTAVFCGNNHEEPVELSKPCMSLEHRNEQHNQLRYVCRQLYTETNGLEFKLNDVVIHGEEPSLARTFFKAVQVNYVKKNLFQFRNIELYCHLGIFDMSKILQAAVVDDPILYDSPQDLIRLAQICRANDKMKIRYMLPQFCYLKSSRLRGHSSSREETLRIGVFFNMLLRGKDLRFLLQETPRPVVEMLINEATELGRRLAPGSSAEQGPESTEQTRTFSEQIATPNLRFFPVWYNNDHVYEVKVLNARDKAKLKDSLKQRLEHSVRLRSENDPIRLVDQHLVDWFEIGI